MSKQESGQVQNEQVQDQQVTDNLRFIEEEIETSSQYFKPKPGSEYIISIDPREKIAPVTTDKFKGSDGNPLKRYELKITHVNSGKQQIWSTSKTLCIQIIEQLKQKFTVLRVLRTGEDRTTTYKIEGIQ